MTSTRKIIILSIGLIVFSFTISAYDIYKTKPMVSASNITPIVYGEKISLEKSKTKKKKVTAKEAKQETQKAKDSFSPLEKLSSMFTSEVMWELEESNYNTLVVNARDQVSDAESALTKRQWNIAHDKAVTSLENSSSARAVLLQSPQWGAQKEQINNDWWRFIDEMKKRIPEAIKKPLPSRDQMFMPVNLLLTCPIPMKVPPRRSCQGKWELKTDAMNCPYLACVKNKKEIPPCADALSYVNRDPKKGSIGQRCCPGLKEVRVDKATGECKRDALWRECQTELDCPQPLCAKISPICLEGICGRPTCSLKMAPIGRPPRPAEWPSPAPTSTEPLIACCLPSGACTIAAIDTCKNSMQGTPAPQSSCNPNQCDPSASALPPPPSYYDRCTIGGIKDYQCADGNNTSWRCECFNFSTQPVADYYYRCIAEPEKSCQAQTRLAPLAVTRIDIRYRMSPDIQIFWDINTPAISSLEYGETASYGSVVRGDSSVGSPDTPDTLHFLGNAGLSVGISNTSKLRPDTTYHFRIVATDTQGNTFVSKDYTFSTVKPYGSKHWIECQTGAVMQKTCVNGELVDRCRCTSEGQWNCVGNIESSCPIPIPAVTPATPATECKTGETKYYNCPQGIEVTSCKCTWEGKWDCIISPEKSCPVPTTSAPTSPIVSPHDTSAG